MGWNVTAPGADSPETLGDSWELHAASWIEWARTPGHDSYWTFHRDSFVALLPAPHGHALDVGCGEGRLPRDLKSLGYDIVGIDISPAMIAAARSADPTGDYRVADAAHLPFADASFELITAFMTLHDMDEFDGALREMSRCLSPGGWLCFSILHPIATAGWWEKHEDGRRRFVIDAPYLETRRYEAHADRAGLTMTFSSYHRPLEAYVGGLREAGFGLDALAEVVDPRDPPDSPRRWVPVFLDARARKI